MYVGLPFTGAPLLYLALTFFFLIGGTLMRVLSFLKIRKGRQ